MSSVLPNVWGHQQDALKKAKNGQLPSSDQLYSNIWVGGENYDREVNPAYVRMPDRTKNIGSVMADMAV